MTFRSTILSFALALALVLATSTACDGQQTHAAEPALRTFLDAVQYQDFDTALGVHVESSGEGVYCMENSFLEVFEQARVAATEAQCSLLRGAGAEALAGVDDEARLLLQIVGFHCRHPQGTCVDYGRRLYRGHLVSFAERGVRGYEIRKVLGDQSRAVGYVDLRLASGQTLHRAVRLRTIQNQWRVEDGLVDDIRPEAPSQLRPEANP